MLSLSGKQGSESLWLCGCLDMKKYSRERFRSSDLWVMSPTRYHYATLLQLNAHRAGGFSINNGRKSTLRWKHFLLLQAWKRYKLSSCNDMTKPKESFLNQSSSSTAISSVIFHFLPLWFTFNLIQTPEIVFYLIII